MEALVNFISQWNGNIVFWICMALTAAVFALSAVLLFRARINAIPATATTALSLALVCYFVTLYGEQAGYAALYAALIVLVGGILTIAASVLNTVKRFSDKRKQKSSETCDPAPPVSAAEDIPVVAATETEQPPAPARSEEEEPKSVTAAIPDSALPEMSVDDVELAVIRAEEAAQMEMEEGKALITQISKLRALPGIDYEEKKKLNALQKRIADIFATNK